jgi:hypothetical protein
MDKELWPRDVAGDSALLLTRRTPIERTAVNPKSRQLNEGTGVINGPCLDEGAGAGPGWSSIHGIVLRCLLALHFANGTKTVNQSLPQLELIPPC